MPLPALRTGGCGGGARLGSEDGEELVGAVLEAHGGDVELGCEALDVEVDRLHLGPSATQSFAGAFSRGRPSALTEVTAPCVGCGVAAGRQVKAGEGDECARRSDAPSAGCRGAGQRRARRSSARGRRTRARATGASAKTEVGKRRAPHSGRRSVAGAATPSLQQCQAGPTRCAQAATQTHAARLALLMTNCVPSRAGRGRA